MRLAWTIFVICASALVLACGDDGDGDSDSGGDGGTSTASGTSNEVTDTTASGGDGSTSSNDTGGVPTSCGEDLTCNAGEVCVQEVFEPPCDPYDPEMGEMCPPDQTPTNCGGAGVPCCCGETPPPAYTCTTPEGCVEAVTCECVTCPGDKICNESVEGPFVCEPPPQA